MPNYLQALLKLAVLASCLSSNVVLAQFSRGEEYILVDYAAEAEKNPVAILQAQIDSGEVTLEYENDRGYLDSLLEALDINPASQLLVFSPTSLQYKLISQATPRALFFNDNTYIGFVLNSTIVEVTTIDEDKGVVFYTFDNAPQKSRYFERATQSCLVCHDTQGTLGGGVPVLMALSSVYSKANLPLVDSINITDQSPIEDRWGGWYVTGRHGLQAHLGNIILEERGDLDALDDFRIWNLDTLADTAYMDPTPYPRDTSDIVALMVLEHQLTVQNQISHIKFKAPALMKRQGLLDDMEAQSWLELSDPAQVLLSGMLNKLVRHLVFLDAANIASRLSGLQEYTDSFQARGPWDSKGRSLRELKLEGTLFRYPLSYLVYSDDLNALPAFAKDYVYQRLAAYLNGEEDLAGNPQYSETDRKAALEILRETKSDFSY